MSDQAAWWRTQQQREAAALLNAPDAEEALMPTELETILARAADLAKHELQANAAARADLERLLQAGKEPHCISPAPGFEVFLQVRKTA